MTRAPFPDAAESPPVDGKSAREASVASPSTTADAPGGVTVDGGAAVLQSSDVARLRLVRVLRRYRAVESASWALVWFALGCASYAKALSRDASVWVTLALFGWVVGAVAHRRAVRVLESVRLLDADTVARTSARAREALSGVGDALRVLAEWADDATAFMTAEPERTSVDPDSPLPPCPVVPRDAAMTSRPGKDEPAMRTRVESHPEVAPPSNKLLPACESEPPPHAKLDPDHDRATCEVCQVVYSKKDPG